MMLSAARVKDRARELGFNLIGLTPARPAPHLAAYLRWVEAGRHGAMAYLAREDRLARRRDLNVILPGVRSLVIVGLDYHTVSPPPAWVNDPARGRIAAYAWGQDYHALMTPRLATLAEWLRSQSLDALQWRAYVDTGALLERDHAQQAGLGFIGKNTLLIHPRRGSDFFLGEILTTAEFDHYDQPQRETQCGSCTRCLTACPTAAFPEPYVLDARRCISYLTIEQHDWIDPALRPLMGNWVFGCDVCQVVCPWQRFAVQTQETAFFPGDLERIAPRLENLLRLDDNEFKRAFQGTPLQRIGRERLVRNACVAAGNSGQPMLIPLLQTLLADHASLVRGHAAWALARLAPGEAQSALNATLQRETHPAVRAELVAALATLH